MNDALSFLHILDVVVLGLVGISALLATINGLTRELIIVVQWAFTITIMIKLTSHVTEFLVQYIPYPSVAFLVSMTLLFICTHFTLGAIFRWLSDILTRTNGVSLSERALGLLYGMARGILGVTLIYTTLTWFTPGNPWLTDAYFSSSLEKSSQILKSLFSSVLEMDKFFTISSPEELPEVLPSLMDTMLAPRDAPQVPQVPQVPGDLRDLPSPLNNIPAARTPPTALPQDNILVPRTGDSSSRRDKIAEPRQAPQKAPENVPEKPLSLEDQTLVPRTPLDDSRWIPSWMKELDSPPQEQP